jgi:hypothetical protein
VLTEVEGRLGRHQENGEHEAIEDALRTDRNERHGRYELTHSPFEIQHAKAGLVPFPQNPAETEPPYPADQDGQEQKFLQCESLDGFKVFLGTRIYPACVRIYVCHESGEKHLDTGYEHE